MNGCSRLIKIGICGRDYGSLVLSSGLNWADDDEDDFEDMNQLLREVIFKCDYLFNDFLNISFINKNVCVTNWRSSRTY